MAGEETTETRQNRAKWVSLVPYGIQEQHPNVFADLFRTFWENRDSLGYAWRILNHGCCDGCSLGTSGMRDWTMEGIHLCNVRLQLLRLNTMSAMDPRLLEDAAALEKLRGSELRKLGRLPVPMMRRHGEIDALWQSGGNFVDTLPEPKRVREAVERIALRIHQDIVASCNMLVEPKDTLLLLPSRTRYEQRGGGTETSTERRVIYSPEIPGPRIPETNDEWEIPVLVAHRADPERAGKFFSWRDTQDIRDEIDRVCPIYRGIAQLRKKGDNFQYGGPRLLTNRFLTPDGKGRFSAINLPGEKIPVGRFLLSTRRGKQFNSMVYAESDPITGLARDNIIMSREDVQRLGLKNGDPILLRGERGEFRGRVKIDRIKPGSVQGHWPELNAVLPAGSLDASGVPDYNAIVEIIPLGRTSEAAD